MTVRVQSDEFGAGRIGVTADLDRDVVAAVFPQRVAADGLTSAPAPTDDGSNRVRLDDLRRAGWEGPGIVRNADGSARFALSHRFTGVAQANELLDQLSGPSGPFAGLRLTRDRLPWSTTVSLAGPGDFRSGLASFGDEQLAAVTGNGAFGLRDAEVLRQAGGGSLDEVFSLRIDARLLDTERSWKLPAGTASPVRLSASTTSWATIAGTAAALAALVAFVALQLRSSRAGDPDDDGDGDDDLAANAQPVAAAPVVNSTGRA